MGTRVRIGDNEFELDFDLPPGAALPPGVERLEEAMEEEEAWSGQVPAELVAYARELAISPEHVGHWVSFFTGHPHGKMAWSEIRPLWKPPRRWSRRRK